MLQSLQVRKARGPDRGAMAAHDPQVVLGEPIELHDNAASNGHGEHHGQEFSLPPADGGRAAWLFLVTCFFVEAIVWGMSNYSLQAALSFEVTRR